VAAAVRLYVRRRTWGDERALAQRARRRLAALWLLGCAQRLRTAVVAVRNAPVVGEWVFSRNHDEGTILYLHGGGYVSCSAATHRPITAALARRAGRRVFTVNYRRAPEHRYPAALDDAVKAYRWLIGQGIAAHNIAVAGDSAGGGLVLALLLRIRDGGGPMPSSAVCFSPWADLAGSGDSVHLTEGRCAMFHGQNIREFARAYLAEASPLDPYASPLYGNLTALPPLLFQVGSDELLLDDARRVHEKVRAAGGTSTLQVYEGMFHGWQMFDGLIPEAGSALRDAAAFINEPGRRSPRVARTVPMRHG
jgi:monoterpene epsilon-lactone hydrolase